ncbi:MAG: DNA repair protein RadC [Chloroflexi bacterium]|nr:DNA repair protein RadC [Chloroflexota bacterium]
MKSLAPAERPRERLIELGPSALSTAELLAIVLRTGQPGEMVTLMAQNLLREFGGLGGLARASVGELAQRKGLGPAKAAELKAALELARRLASEQPEERFQIRSPNDVAHLLQLDMGVLEQEELRVLLLDTKNRVLGIRTIYVGSVNTSLVRIGEVFKHAVRENCPAIIVVHNHPSGDPTPSPEDVRVTEALAEAGKLLDIDLLDHVVIGRRGHISLKERRLGFR